MRNVIVLNSVKQMKLAKFIANSDDKSPAIIHKSFGKENRWEVGSRWFKSERNAKNYWAKQVLIYFFDKKNEFEFL